MQRPGGREGRGVLATAGRLWGDRLGRQGPHWGLDGLRSLHFTPRGTGGLLSWEFETSLRGAGNSLGNAGRAETDAGSRTCRGLSPSAAGCGLQALAQCRPCLLGVLGQILSLSGLVSMFSKQSPVV